jgi:hypothetical protein
MSLSLLKLWTRPLALAALAALGAACAPAIRYRELLPARVKLAQAPSFALGRVDIKSDCGFEDQAGKAQGFFAVAAAFVGDVMRQGANSARLRAALSADMMSEISKNEFAVYSDSSAAYGLNLSGSLTGRDSSKEEKATADASGNGRKHYEVKITRSFELDMDYEIVDTKDDGRVAQSQMRLEQAYPGVAETEPETLAKLPGCEDAGTRLLGRAIRDIVRDILPHYRTVKRELQKGEHAAILEAAKAAAAGDLDRARGMWTGLLRSHEGLSAKDRAAIHHNLGVCYEVQDQIAEAESEFEQCSREPEGAWCVQGLSRLKARSAVLDELSRDGAAGPHDRRGREPADAQPAQAPRDTGQGR